MVSEHESVRLSRSVSCNVAAEPLEGLGLLWEPLLDGGQRKFI